jgi:membrane protease YdiL (CAAX protease family)
LSQVLLIVLYICAPVFLLRMHRFWGVPAAILSLWIPIEAGLFTRFGISAPITIALGIGACLVTFHSRRDVLDIRAAFNIFTIEWKRALVLFVMFAAIAIPLGLAIGFIRPVFDPDEVRQLPLMLAAIFFFNALPEEILFRALLQNWIEKGIRNRVAALAVASTIFGAAHFNNGFPVPNYRYVLMATIAGVFYGLAWRSKRNALTSSLTHTFVNTGWNLFFR